MGETEGFRLEKDSIGEKMVPADAYYGVQTLRAYENFRISGYRLHPEMIRSLAQIKKACAKTNSESGELSEEKEKAIMQACDEIIDGKYTDQFIVDPIQGGAGTSINMNANEVIANRAIEILGGRKGDYSIVNPNDDVNFGQSTNDIFPSCGKITALKLLIQARAQLARLAEALDHKAEEFDDVIKMGRTQLQDAVPIRLGQEFAAYAAVVRRDVRRFDSAEREMRTLNIGGTAIGTGINADVAAFIARLTTRAPEERPQDASAALEELQRLQTGLTIDDWQYRLPAGTDVSTVVGDPGMVPPAPPAPPTDQSDDRTRPLGETAPNATSIMPAEQSQSDPEATARLSLGGHESPTGVAEKGDSKQQGRNRKHTPVIIACITAAALVCAGGGGYAWWYFQGPGSYWTLPQPADLSCTTSKTCRISNVKWSSYEELLKFANIEYETTEVYSDSVSAGDIVSTDPANVGSHVSKRRHQKVRVVVSKGRKWQGSCQGTGKGRLRRYRADAGQR